MEYVGKVRRLFGILTTRSAFRTRLLGFLLIFGLVNIIFLVLYPQLYGGEKLSPAFDVNVTKSTTIQHENRIVSFKIQDRIGTTERTDLNPVKGLDEFSKLDFFGNRKPSRPSSSLGNALPNGQNNYFDNKNIPSDELPPKDIKTDVLVENSVKKNEVELTQPLPKQGAENSETTQIKLANKNVYNRTRAGNTQSLNSSGLSEQHPITSYAKSTVPSRAPPSTKSTERVDTSLDNTLNTSGAVNMVEKAPTKPQLSQNIRTALVNSSKTEFDVTNKESNFSKMNITFSKPSLPSAGSTKSTEISVPAHTNNTQNLNTSATEYVQTNMSNSGSKLPETNENITENARKNLTTDISSEQQSIKNKTTLDHQHQNNRNTSKLEGNASTSVEDRRATLEAQHFSAERIEAVLKRINSTKQTSSENQRNLNPTKASVKFTTSHPQIPWQEPSCIPFVLSKKSTEYTKKKYKLYPEITKCKDQEKPSYELCKVAETKTNDPLTELQIKCDFSACDRARPMYIETMDKMDGLMKKREIPKNANDAEIEKLVLSYAENTRKNSLLFLFVNCSDSSGGVVAQLLTFLPSLPPRKENEATRDKISINILLVDSVSLLHFHRSLPQTVSYLKEIKQKPSYPASVFNFEFFQAVHGHTNENERALFDGTLFPVAKLGGKARTRSPVKLDTLYSVFKRAGFATMFLDDLCWRGMWGIMDKYKIGSWGRLQEKLSVSSIDTRGITEASCKILHRNNMKTSFYDSSSSNHQICFNAKHQHEYVLDYLTRYLDAVVDAPQTKPLFAYTTTHVSHDNVGIRVQTLDPHLKEFIQKMSTMNNTLTIIFADHGNTYTSYQATDDGKREMYHPFMLMLLPKKMGERFGGMAVRNLQENQRRLFTLFDLRAGLVELARFDGQSPLKPEGIFGKLAFNRTCDDLLITEASKCLCEGWETPVANTTDQLVFAEFAIGELNNKIQASLLESRVKGLRPENSRVVFGACQRLRVQHIRDVKTRKMPDGVKATTMDVKVQSGNLLDQEEIITVQVLSAEKPTGTYEMALLSFNRVSTYGPYRSCVDKDVDVKLCICDDPKNPRPQTTIQDVFGKHSVITKLRRCLYEIKRTYNDNRNALPLVWAFEIVNICKDKEITVRFNAVGENTRISTKLPIIAKLPAQTARFVATAGAVGNTKDARPRTMWKVESTKYLKSAY